MDQRHEIGKSSRDGFLLAAGMAAVALLVTYPIQNYDIFWHLANGREMLARRTIINEEIFSYTVAGKKFHNHEWLSQVLFYYLFSRFGANGILALKAVVVGVMGFFVYRTSRFAGASPVFACLLLMFAVVAGLGQYLSRPQIFSLLFLGVLGYFLYGYRVGRVSFGWLFVIPPMMVLWDNLHGAVYGFLFLNAFVVGETVNYYLRKKTSFPLGKDCTGPLLENQGLKRLWIIYMVTIAAMAINPYGLSNYGTFFDFASRDSFAKLIQEFQPPSLSKPALAPYWALLAVSAVLTVVFLRRLDVTQIFVMMPFVFLSLKYVRATAAFAIVALPALSYYWTLVSGRTEENRRGRMTRWSAVVLLALAFTYVIYFKFYSGSTKSFGLGIYEDYYPSGSARFIAETGIRGNMYNPGNLGGYLAYTLGPERKIFMYNHHTVFKDMPKLYFHSNEYLDKYDITYAIVNDPFVMKSLLKLGWTPVFWERSAAVLLKDVEANRPIIGKYGLRYYAPLTSLRDLESKATSPEARAAIARELSNILSFRHDVVLADSLAMLLEDEGVRASLEGEAVDIIKGALRFNSDNAGLWTNIGAQYYLRGERDKAKDAYERALSIDARNYGATIGLAYLEYERGDYAAAEAAFRSAVGIDGSEAGAYYGLGLTYMAMGRNAEAKDKFEAFLRLQMFGLWAENAKGFLRDIESKGNDRPK